MRVGKQTFVKLRGVTKLVAGAGSQECVFVCEDGVTWDRTMSDVGECVLCSWV
jgi:hypothetical protein